MAGKIRSTRGNFTQLTSFQLEYWPELETLHIVVCEIFESIREGNELFNNFYL
jgi:hypothetical protein